MPLVHVWQPSDEDDECCGHIWFGILSACKKTGAILKFVKELLDAQPVPVNLAIPRCDGVGPQRIPERFILEESDVYASYASRSPEKCILALLSSVDVYNPNFLYLPLDDFCFELGTVEAFYSQIRPVPWDARKPIAFWRGHMSGERSPYNLRMRAVMTTRKHSLCDIKFAIQDGYPPPEHLRDIYAPFVRLWEFLNYKYLLILDGACIASNHQWTFASGAVPILVTHPGNEFWFRRYLEPMKHYVPVSYDLSDLTEKIEWLVAHDDEARQIAQNAMDFASYYLSAGFQRYHLENEVKRLLA